MVDIVFGNTIRELLNKINEQKLSKNDIISIIPGSGVYSCFYQVKDGRDKK